MTGILPADARLLSTTPQTRYYAESWRYRMGALCRGARYRAKRKGLEMGIDTDWLMAQLIAQSYLCRQTHIPLMLAPVNNPWAPSLDRLDTMIGYTPENVQIVCHMYNNAKNTADGIHVAQFSAALVKNTQDV